MDHYSVRGEPIGPRAEKVRPEVPTLLIGQNRLIRSGLSHILAGTHFVISEETAELTSESRFLCLIYDDLTAEDLSATIVRLKTQWPSARAVLLSEHSDPAALSQAFQVGLNGLCPTTMNREVLIRALELVMLDETFIPASLGLTMLDEQHSSYQGAFGGSATRVPAHHPRGFQQADCAGPWAG
jgi:two-component system nitrate/nitrite response regulator NarL